MRLNDWQPLCPVTGALGGVVWQEGGQEYVTDAALPAPQNLAEISDIALQEKKSEEEMVPLA